MFANWKFYILYPLFLRSTVLHLDNCMHHLYRTHLPIANIYSSIYLCMFWFYDHHRVASLSPPFTPPAFCLTFCHNLRNNFCQRLAGVATWVAASHISIYIHIYLYHIVLIMVVVIVVSIAYLLMSLVKC